MARFRNYIDPHAGAVKRIVGGTLSTTSPTTLTTNAVSEHSAVYFARLDKDNVLTGAHVIILGLGIWEIRKRIEGAGVLDISSAAGEAMKMEDSI